MQYVSIFRHILILIYFMIDVVIEGDDDDDDGVRKVFVLKLELKN